MTLNVATYGAVGDYNPATGTGTDDTTSFTNAISAAQRLGQELYVPAGNYKITSPPGGATVLGSAAWPAATGARIYGDGQFVSNLYFVGNTGNAPPTIQLSGQNSFLRDIGIVAQDTCATLLEIGPAPTGELAGSGQGSYIQIANCRFAAYSDKDTYAIAIFCNDLAYSTIAGCLIIGQPYNSSLTRVFVGTGISFSGCINNTVTQNTITYLNTAILINPSSTSPPVSLTQGLLISQNAIFGNSSGIDIQPGGTAYVSAVNNIIDYNTANGVSVGEGSGAITSNYIGLDNEFGTASAGIVVSAANHMSIVGNTIVGYSSGSANNFGILLFASVANSMVSSNGIANVNTSILIGPSCSNCVITGNSGTGYTGTDFIVNDSTSTIVANNTM
jgi:hypothetical protein